MKIPIITAALLLSACSHPLRLQLGYRDISVGVEIPASTGKQPVRVQPQK